MIILLRNVVYTQEGKISFDKFTWPLWQINELIK